MVHPKSWIKPRVSASERVQVRGPVPAQLEKWRGPAESSTQPLLRSAFWGTRAHANAPTLFGWGGSRWKEGW